MLKITFINNVLCSPVNFWRIYETRTSVWCWLFVLCTSLSTYVENTGGFEYETAQVGHRERKFHNVSLYFDRVDCTHNSFGSVATQRAFFCTKTLRKFRKVFPKKFLILCAFILISCLNYIFNKINNRTHLFNLYILRKIK